jgi:hypothetical protein
VLERGTLPDMWSSQNGEYGSARLHHRLSTMQVGCGRTDRTSPFEANAGISAADSVHEEFEAGDEKAAGEVEVEWYRPKPGRRQV